MRRLLGLVGNSHHIEIWWDNTGQFLNPEASVEAIIVHAESGYTSFGNLLRELNNMGYYEEENQLNNMGYYLQQQALPTIRRVKFHIKEIPSLRWLVLVPSTQSRAYYSRYARYDPLGVDTPATWFYQVMWAALYAAVEKGRARIVGVSHLTTSVFDNHQSASIGEALGHWADKARPTPLRKIVFLGCCIQEDPIFLIPRILNPEGGYTYHRPIRVRIETNENYEDIILDPKGDLEI